MGSSDQLFTKKITIHQILGGRLVADVVLWRRKNVSKGILVVGFGAWLTFQICGYTLLSFLSNVLLILTCVLFLWAKSARILNRPGPQLPHFHLSEEMVNEAAETIRVNLNTLFSVSRNIALGYDTESFFRAAAVMLLISLVGSLTDLITLGYISLVIILTVPALYEKLEDQIDGFFVKWWRLFKELNVNLYNNVQRIIAEMKKLSDYPV
ncbi:hypothetical protein QQ045_030879 [Rhodiola kirilowii]